VKQENETSPVTDEVGAGDSEHSEFHTKNAQLRYDWLEATYDRNEALKSADMAAATAAEIRRENIQNEFFTVNRRLAMSAVRAFTSRAGHLAEDYEQSAVFGMWVAFAGNDVEKRDNVTKNDDGTYTCEVGWDPAKATFGGYSRVYIRGQIQRQVASSETGLSYSQWSAKPKIIDARDELREILGREPSADEVAAEVGMLPDNVRAILTPPSVSTSMELGEGLELGDTLVEALYDSTDAAVADMVDEWRAEACRERLTAREMLCVALRKGFPGTEPLPIIDTASRLGLNRGVVSQADKTAYPKVASVVRERVQQMRQGSL
jgi:DNA-directed RNA polymerase specialized sigma subunit